VAPIAHTGAAIVLMDFDLMRYARVWPAAGHPNTMFAIEPATLARIAGAQTIDVAQERNHAPT
jgi:prolyl-tRNA editing enzyme YbaK/EbsC (Cys-tRNA(Pro) deacylase)